MFSDKFIEGVILQMAFTIVSFTLESPLSNKFEDHLDKHEILRRISKLLYGLLLFINLY